MRLPHDEERMKRHGRHEIMAVTNTVILLFDLAMLLGCRAAVSVWAGGDSTGVLIPVIALMSSFGPTVALANLGSTLQNTFAAGNRVLDILDEYAGGGGNRRTGRTSPFPVQRRRMSPSAYGEETDPLTTCRLEIPAGLRGGHCGAQRQRQIHPAEAAHALLGRAEGRVYASPARTFDQINTANLRAWKAL